MSRAEFVWAVLVVAACGFLCPVALAAGRLAMGDRIRITAPSLIPTNPALFSAANVGKLVSLDNDTLTFESSVAAAPLRVPLKQVLALEVSRGRDRYTIKGAVVGGIAGFILAAVTIGASPGTEFVEPTPREVLEVLLLGAGAGLAAGAMVGSAFTSDRWEPFPLGELHGGLFHGGASRSAVALRFRF